MSKAGRKGNGYETNMEVFRKYFSRGKKRSQYRNAVKLKKYCKWTSKTPEELIKEYVEARKSVNTLKDWERDTRSKIIEYYNWLKTKGYKINYCRTLPLGILAFYSENCETIKDVTKEFNSVQIPTDEYVFTQEVLRKAFYYADLEGQTLLSLAVALGFAYKAVRGVCYNSIYTIMRIDHNESLQQPRKNKRYNDTTCQQPQQQHLTTTN